MGIVEIDWDYLLGDWVSEGARALVSLFKCHIESGELVVVGRSWVKGSFPQNPFILVSS